MHRTRHPRTAVAPATAVLTTAVLTAVLTVSVLLGTAGSAVADVQPTPVACTVQRAAASAQEGGADWVVTCAAPRNVWVGVDYYADAPNSQEETRWLPAGESWTGGVTLPTTPPLRQVCLTVLESGRSVIGHVCDTAAAGG